MSVVLLSSDLMTASRAEGAARRVGRSLRVCSSVESMLAACGDQPPTLVIIDLTTPAVDLPAVVGALKSHDERPRLLAFGPHVHESRLTAARAAGCDTVISRGEFFAGLDAILREPAGDD